MTKITLAKRVTEHGFLSPSSISLLETRSHNGRLLGMGFFHEPGKIYTCLGVLEQEDT